MSEQQLFQEVPKDTTACTLVTDTADSGRIRNFIKEKVFKKLNANDENFEIVENEFQWSITQRFVAKPAMINVRLRSYHKGMKLIAYNSFEIYHGNCEITKMRVNNTLSEDKLEKHVDDAIKSFKEQAKFGEFEATQYKKEHAKELRKQKKQNLKLEKDFQGLDLEKNKDGLVKVFWSYRNYYSRGYGRSYSQKDYNIAMEKSKKGEYVQLVDVVKCNKFVFAPKILKSATEIDEKIPAKIGKKSIVYINSDYDMKSGIWNYRLSGLDANTVFELFKKNQKGFKTPDKIHIMPYMEVGNIPRYYHGNNTSVETEFRYSAITKDFIELIKHLKLKVWKITMD